MGTEYNFTQNIKTEAPLVVVMEAAQDAISPLGGSVKTNDKKGIITIEDGKIGIFGDFLFDSTAKIMIKKKDKGIYKLKCNVDKRPNFIFWLIFIIPFCTGIWPAWGLNVFYLFVDLGKEYQKKLANIEAHL